MLYKEAYITYTQFKASHDPQAFMALKSAAETQLLHLLMHIYLEFSFSLYFTFISFPCNNPFSLSLFLL